MEDVKIRRVWSLSRGVLIDECEIEDVFDAVLNRELKEPDDIRIELVFKGAQDLYMRPRPDVAEIYSNPRVCQEATVRKYSRKLLKPGWSLDLSTKDPLTGRPWDLSNRNVQARVRKLVIETEPFCIVGSPPCTPVCRRDAEWSSNDGRRGRPRPTPRGCAPSPRCLGCASFNTRM